MTFGQDQAGEEPAMVGSQTTKLPIRNARRPNQDQNSSSSLNSVGTGSGALPRRRYPKARYSPVSNVLRWSVSCANSEGSPQPKYLSSAVSASDYYYRGYLFIEERIPPFTAGVNPTLADQSTDDTLAGYSTVIDTIK